MQVVAKFEACRTEAVEIVRKEMVLTKRLVKGLESALNLYAMIIIEKLPTTEFIPKLLLSERLRVVKEMKKLDFFKRFNVIDILRADCVHIVHDCFLIKCTKLNANALTLEKIEVYRHQVTDIDRVTNCCLFRRCG